MIDDFSVQIKQGTKKSHSAAENTKFVSQFLKGVLEPEKYRTLLADFYFVYRAMEEEIDKLKDHPVVGPLAYEELYRTASLAKDLSYYYGPDWRNIVTPTESCQQYVNRIREVAQDNPYLLVGHHYTRYLGDLSGGQILKNIAKSSLDLPVGEGLNFYEFKNITDKKAFKETYRATLNTLPLDQHEVNAIITEANFAFRLNMYMFDELEGDSFKAFMQVLCGFVTEKLGLDNEEDL